MLTPELYYENAQRTKLIILIIKATWVRAQANSVMSQVTSGSELFYYCNSLVRLALSLLWVKHTAITIYKKLKIETSAFNSCPNKTCHPLETDMLEECKELQLFFVVATPNKVKSFPQAQRLECSQSFGHFIWRSRQQTRLGLCRSRVPNASPHAKPQSKAICLWRRGAA